MQDQDADADLPALAVAQRSEQRHIRPAGDIDILPPSGTRVLPPRRDGSIEECLDQPRISANCVAPMAVAEEGFVLQVEDRPCGDDADTERIGVAPASLRAVLPDHGGDPSTSGTMLLSARRDAGSTSRISAPESSRRTQKTRLRTMLSGSIRRVWPSASRMTELFRSRAASWASIRTLAASSSVAASMRNSPLSLSISSSTSSMRNCGMSDLLSVRFRCGTAERYRCPGTGFRPEPVNELGPHSVGSSVPDRIARALAIAVAASSSAAAVITPSRQVPPAADLSSAVTVSKIEASSPKCPTLRATVSSNCDKTGSASPRWAASSPAHSPDT